MLILYRAKFNSIDFDIEPPKKKELVKGKNEFVKLLAFKGEWRIEVKWWRWVIRRWRRKWPRRRAAALVMRWKVFPVIENSDGGWGDANIAQLFVIVIGCYMITVFIQFLFYAILVCTQPPFNTSLIFFSRNL